MSKPVAARDIGIGVFVRGWTQVMSLLVVNSFGKKMWGIQVFGVRMRGSRNQASIFVSKWSFSPWK
jgi:hypothetical protein